LVSCSIAFLAVSQGLIGWILGVCFFFLALFNFFLIYRVRATLRGSLAGFSAV